MICKLLQRQWFCSLPKLTETFTISPSQLLPGVRLEGRRVVPTAADCSQRLRPEAKQFTCSQPRPAYSCWVTSLIIFRAMSGWSEGTWKQGGSALVLPALCLGLGSGLAPRPCSWEGDQLCDNTLGGQPCLGAILKRAPKRAPLLWNDPRAGHTLFQAPMMLGCRGPEESTFRTETCLLFRNFQDHCC